MAKKIFDILEGVHGYFIDPISSDAEKIIDDFYLQLGVYFSGNYVSLGSESYMIRDPVHLIYISKFDIDHMNEDEEISPIFQDCLNIIKQKGKIKD